MVENIAIVGLDRRRSYEIAKMLASELEMQFLDTIELFEFDNAPRTLSVMLNEFGLNYFRKKEKGAIGYAAEFSNTVIHLESGMAENQANFESLKQTCLLIYIHKPTTQIKQCLENQKYDDDILSKFYNVSINKLRSRAKELKQKSQIVITDSQQSSLKIVSEILREIKKYQY